MNSIRAPHAAFEILCVIHLQSPSVFGIYTLYPSASQWVLIIKLRIKASVMSHYWSQQPTPFGSFAHRRFKLWVETRVHCLKWKLQTDYSRENPSSNPAKCRYQTYLSGHPGFGSLPSHSKEWIPNPGGIATPMHHQPFLVLPWQTFILSIDRLACVEPLYFTSGNIEFYLRPMSDPNIVLMVFAITSLPGR